MIKCIAAHYEIDALEILRQLLANVFIEERMQRRNASTFGIFDKFFRRLNTKNTEAKFFKLGQLLTRSTTDFYDFRRSNILEISFLYFPGQRFHESDCKTGR